MSETSEIESKFNNTIKAVKEGAKNNKLTNENKLDMYKYYKQATEGDCELPQPWSVKGFEAHAKWKAWVSVYGMKKEEAMTEYINLYDKLICG